MGNIKLGTTCHGIYKIMNFLPRQEQNHKLSPTAMAKARNFSSMYILTTSISVLECPILHTIHPVFILSICALVTTFLLPVHVINTSKFFTTSSMRTTRKPSMLEINLRILKVSTDNNSTPVFSSYCNAILQKQTRYNWVLFSPFRNFLKFELR